MGRAYGDYTKDIIDTLKTMPGLTSAEVMELLPHIRKSSVYTIISKLYQQGTLYASGQVPLIRSNGSTVMVNRYAFSDNPVPLTKKLKLKKPTPTGYEAQISELKAQIAELEAWKEAAVTRFPDLAVPPIVLRARALVAEEVAAGGDHALADQIKRGLKDATLMVRVAIKALEE